MNYFDKTILEFFNGFSQRSSTLDNAIHLISNTELLKGGIVVAILWALWFVGDNKEAVAETRKTVLATIAGSFVALSLTMILAITLPFRFRPIHQLGITFKLPIGIHTRFLQGWSSFPSDHATLFAGLVTGIFLISRPLGFFSIIYVLLVVLIPRIYLGFHYPTDILAGILIGSVCVMLTNGSMIKKTLADPLMEWSEKYPCLFYGAFFLIFFETAELFEDLRHIGRVLFPVVKNIVARIF